MLSQDFDKLDFISISLLLVGLVGGPHYLILLYFSCLTYEFKLDVKSDNLLVDETKVLINGEYLGC